MDGYEQASCVGAVPALIALGWFWGALRVLTLARRRGHAAGHRPVQPHTDGFGADLAAGDKVFLLKYFLSSQSAILWMSLLFFMSTIFYWIGLLPRASRVRQGGTGRAPTPAHRLAALAWAAVFMALVGTLVRWFESHQIAPDIGHIPVSNLYEVFVLFCWLTTLFYLYYEQHYKTRALGAFVMLIVSAAVGFLLWYTVAREAHEIQPLVPALQSWWMKLHVPANFIGYGTFSLSAMVAFAYLLKSQADRDAAGSSWRRCGCWAWCCASSRWSFRRVRPQQQHQLLGACTSASARSSSLRDPAGARPHRARACPLELLDDVMYKAIAVGFAFFTIATILGAFWAAEAWGGYWSWDPKETWALIVWLNYAAWLHMRLMKGLRGTVVGLVGAGRPGRHHLRLPGREHVPVGPALLRRAVNAQGALIPHAPADAA